MSSSTAPRLPILLNSVGVVLLLGSAGGVLRVLLVEDDTGTADQLSSSLGFLLAATTVVIALLGSIAAHRRAARLPLTGEQVDQAAATLAELVGEQWAIEARLRLLDDPEPMPVRWRLTGVADLMDRVEVIVGDGAPAFDANAARIADLVAAFRDLPRRRLVVTGGAGSGKTTLAVQLVRELLAHPLAGEPVPVVLALSGWDVEARPRLQDWLVMELERTYPGLAGGVPGVAAALVARGRILPVLDGFDEVAPAHRAALVAELNPQPDRALVVTSRRPEYRAALRDAQDVLTGAAVIGPHVLTTGEAAGYLRKSLGAASADWPAVLDRMVEGSAPQLADVCRSPLGVWLVRSVYLEGRRDPTPLVDGRFPTAAALRVHLLDQLVPALVGADQARCGARSTGPGRRPVRRHDPDRLRRCLTVVAEQMRDADTRDWRWWEFPRHAFPHRGDLRQLRAVAGAAGGVVGGTSGGVVAGPIFGYGPATGALAGFAAGCVIGLLNMFSLPLLIKLRPECRDVRPQLIRGSRGGLSRRRVVNLVVALVLAVPTILAVGTLVEGPGGFVLGGVVASALLVDPLVGAADGSAAAMTPGRSYRGDQALYRITMVSIAVGFGPLMGLMVSGGLGRPSCLGR